MATKEGQTTENWARGISDYEEFDKVKCLELVEKAYQGIHLELDLAKAVEDADLIIESMAENVEDKIVFYKKLAPLMPKKTVLVTNSSTLLPSKFAKYTGRPEKYLSLHFANSIWKNNTAEIMSQSKTDCQYFEQLMNFAKEIRMIPLPVRKEKSGYLLNSMLIPLLFSGMDLYVNGVSDPESIDKAWTLAFIVANITRRRTNQSGNRMSFLIFAHINSGHIIFVIEEIFCQSFCQFGFTNSRCSEEKKTSDWFFLVT